MTRFIIDEEGFNKSPKNREDFYHRNEKKSSVKPNLQDSETVEQPFISKPGGLFSAPKFLRVQKVLDMAAVKKFDIIQKCFRNTFSRKKR